MDVIAFIVGVMLLVIGLGVSIALHEVGHLVPAKAFGVRVGQYMVGMGRTLWSKQKGETEYGIKALPVGGYISMAGMYPPAQVEQTAMRGRLFQTLVQDAQAANAETLEGVDERRAFYRLPVWKRIIIMVGGPLMNLMLALVLFAVLFSGIGLNQASATVAEVSQCVVLADEVSSGADGAECGATDPVAPAAAAGVLPGDRIVSIDGVAVENFADVSAVIQANPGAAVPLVVERDSSEMTLRLSPLDNAGVGFAGITSQMERMREPIWVGPQMALENVGAVTTIVLDLPARLYDTAYDLFTGGERDVDGPLSVIGVGRLAGEAAASDAPVVDRIAMIVNLLGALNIALFVFNLIPLLPLDGGHILIALWDGAKRLFAKLFGRPEPKPTDATKLVPITLVVVVLMIGMGALLFAADIFNPIDLFGQ